MGLEIIYYIPSTCSGGRVKVLEWVIVGCGWRRFIVCRLNM